MIICTKCGWKFPSTHSATACRFCGTAFKQQLCSTCNTVKTDEDFNYIYDKRKQAYFRRHQCKACERIRTTVRVKKLTIEQRELAKKLYADWIATTSKVPYKPLTEEEWLSTCKHFGGCALCGDKHIETRHFFIQYKEGGRYAPWNILPLCGKCSVKRYDDNPFKSMYRKLKAANSIDQEVFTKLYDFFRKKVDEYESKANSV